MQRNIKRTGQSNAGSGLPGLKAYRLNKDHAPWKKTMSYEGERATKTLSYKGISGWKKNTSEKVQEAAS